MSKRFSRKNENTYFINEQDSDIQNINENLKENDNDECNNCENKSSYYNLSKFKKSNKIKKQDKTCDSNRPDLYIGR